MTIPCPVPGAPEWDIDPYSMEVLRDLEPWYEGLRERGPAVWLSKYGVWAVGRHAEVQEAFSDWKRFCSSRGVGMSDFKTEKPWRPPSIVLEVDPPDHTRTRKVISRALSPRAVADAREGFLAEAERIVDELLTRDSFDLVKDLAEPYPLKIFPDAVGYPDEDRSNLLLYGAMVFNSLGPDNELRQDATAKAGAIVPWIMERCKRAALINDGFAETMYQAADEGDISHEEAGLLVRSLLSAGIDTTVAGIGLLLKLFSENPDQWDILRSDPSLIRNAFEEALRVHTPVHAFYRTANLDTEISGIPIAEGSKIMCVLGAANLDERKFDNPETFDITRRASGHIAFGTGVHGCVGQTVARQEIDALLTVMLPKVSRIEPLEKAVWRPGNALRTLDHAQIRFHA